MALFDFLFKHQREIEALFDQYLDAWEECVEIFGRAMASHAESGIDSDFVCLQEEIQTVESQADELRRRIEYRMYQKALLPESRGDIVGLLEHLDLIPNRTETILCTIALLKVEFPPALLHDLGSLIRETLVALKDLLRVARQIFHIREKLYPIIANIDKTESRCDFFERGALKQLFELDDVKGLDKVAIREIVLLIAGLTDLAENIGDRMLVVAAKRRV